MMRLNQSRAKGTITVVSLAVTLALLAAIVVSSAAEAQRGGGGRGGGGRRKALGPEQVLGRER
jgi:uncharacterized membrane protein